MTERPRHKRPAQRSKHRAQRSRHTPQAHRDRPAQPTLHLPKPKFTDPPPEGLPATLHRDEALWVVNKPAGWLTHSDGQGERPDLVTWLTEQSAREGEPLSRPLGVHQRLDVSTTGVIAFSLSDEGARALQEATQQEGKRRYLAVTEGLTPSSGRVDAPVPAQPHKRARTAYQRLRVGGTREHPWSLVMATPLTGRTHQIRAHLASLNAPIRGDGRYGDPYDLRAPRALLHAYQLTLGGVTFTAPPPPEFARYLTPELRGEGEAWSLTRSGLYVPDFQDCFRLHHGEGDEATGWRLDRYGDWLWAIHDEGAPLGPLPEGAKGIYKLDALIDRSGGAQQPPRLWRGEPAPDALEVMEAGVRYHVELGEQLSTGLFLDQRPQRAWLSGRTPQHTHSLSHPSLTPPLTSGMRLLNTFAHAGGFSVAAACAGAETVSVDLSRKWLERVPLHLALNGLSEQGHQLLTGDVFEWVRRLAKRGERFEMIILDPPSTSVGKAKKRWSAKRDYPELVRLALPLLAPGGRLMTSTNHRQLTPARFTQLVASALPEGLILERVCAPGVDFPTDGPMSVKNLVWRAPL